ncbi:hypothetical protein BKA93DRAFT_741746 [Sparassis latifolia]
MSKKNAKTQPPKDNSYELRDVVLAKVRGYPPWPGMIVDPESVPQNVSNERPNAKSKKGNWYCVRFFPAGDYAWMVPKDISKLQPHEIQAYINEPYKRSGDLLQGYRIALDPTKWEEEREALRAEAAEAEANAEVDQLDASEEDEDMDEGEPRKKSRKRKRDSEPAPAKTSRAKSKPKKESAEPAPKKKAAGGKGRRNGVKSKAMVESEDEGAEPEEEDAGPSKQTSPPPAKKAKRENQGEEEGESAQSNDPEAMKVREWRHKLQKAFLGKVVPKEEEMPPLDQLFATIENYENMTIHCLSFSKIGKVMRHLHALSEEKVPRDSEFKFRDRAKALVDKWQDIVNANKTNGEPKTSANGASASPQNKPEATNGKVQSEEPKEGHELAMEVDADADADAKGEEAPAADAEAEEEPDDAHADPAGDESVLADVTMSEAA